MSLPIEHNEGRIYPMDDGTFTVSFRDQWICGAYKDLTCAKYAIDITAKGHEDWLQRMWDNLTATPKVVNADIIRIMERIEMGL